MASDLPTIEYVGADGVRRELDFQRAPHAPRQALLVESEETEGEMRHVGTEQLRELRVDGCFGAQNDYNHTQRRSGRSLPGGDAR